MQAFERLINRVATVVDGAAAVFLAVITALTFVTVVLRYAFNVPLPGSFDVSRLLLGVAIFWGIAAAAWRKEHIQVDLFWQVMPPRVQRVIDVFSDLVFTAFIGVFAWMLFWQVGRVRASGQTTFELGLPVWVFHGIAWLGIAFCFLVLIARLLRTLLSARVAGGTGGGA